jgi:hypothetical protein
MRSGRTALNAKEKGNAVKAFPFSVVEAQFRRIVHNVSK